MGFRGLVGTAAALGVAVAVFGAYAPGAVDRWAPLAGASAHRIHDALMGGAPRLAAAAPADSTSQLPPVSVAVARRVDFPVYIDGLGQAQAYNTVTVRTRVDGQIEKIAFDEGQMLKGGDLVAQIDPRPFQAALDQAKAKLAQDQANLANAKLDLQRYATLVKQDSGSRQQFDTQNALVNQLIAQVAADAAAIDAAQVQLDYTTMRAPLTGRVGFRLVDQGNLVSATQQTGIVTIAQLEPIAVLFTAPEDDIWRINAASANGAPLVEVRTADGARLLAVGKLTVVDNRVDVATGTIHLKAEFANKDHALWPGLAVATRLRIDTAKNALVVPDRAVQRGPDGLFVYVIDAANRASTRPVVVSHEDQDLAVIDKGLQDGDRVVTVGQFGLQPGARVSIEASANTGS